MGPEIVTVSAGGALWSAFERVHVTAGAEEAARSFMLEIAAEPSAASAAWTFACGTPVSIMSNGSLLVTGYVDRYQPHLNEHSHAIIHVSGRSKAQDAIDSSALHDTGRFENQTVLQIAQQLDKFGVGFTSDQMSALEKIPFYQLTPGETVHRCIEKLCRSQGLQLAGQPDGSVKITKGSQGSNSALIEGVNCKALSADHNWAGRHSQAIVRGQRPIGTGKDNLQIEETAQDGAVNRYRPVLIVNDDDTDSGRAKKRAQHRLAREAGHALRANIVTQGFHDDAGVLWTPCYTSWLESPFLAIEQNMLIDRVQYSQDRHGGSVTHVSLCDPQALGGEAGKGGSANAAWSTSADES